jgi:hypothetical protein
MAIAVVSKLVVRRRKFLETLRRHTGKVTGELSIFSENDGTASDEAVDQRLLSHRWNHNRGRKKEMRSIERKMEMAVVERERSDGFRERKCGEEEEGMKGFV